MKRQTGSILLFTHTLAPAIPCDALHHMHAKYTECHLISTQSNQPGVKGVFISRSKFFVFACVAVVVVLVNARSLRWWRWLREMRPQNINASFDQRNDGERYTQYCNICIAYRGSNCIRVCIINTGNSLHANVHTNSWSTTITSFKHSWANMCVCVCARLYVCKTRHKIWLLYLQFYYNNALTLLFFFLSSSSFSLYNDSLDITFYILLCRSLVHTFVPIVIFFLSQCVWSTSHNSFRSSYILEIVI